MGLFNKTLKSRLNEAGIPYKPEQIERCEMYYKLVVEANRNLNLTRITGEAQAAGRHFADSRIAAELHPNCPAAAAL